MFRARWCGIAIRIQPAAHRCLKAYYVERNRLCTVVKNFPFSMLLRAPFAAAARYFWHFVSLFEGKGKAAEFRARCTPAWLPFLVLRAHASMLIRLASAAEGPAQDSFFGNDSPPKEFRELLQRHAITVRKVASL